MSDSRFDGYAFLAVGPNSTGWGDDAVAACMEAGQNGRCEEGFRVFYAHRGCELLPDGAPEEDAHHPVVRVGHLCPIVSGFVPEDELVVTEGIPEGVPISSSHGGPACECHMFARTFRLTAEGARCLECGLVFPVKKHLLNWDRLTWARVLAESDVAAELAEAAAERKAFGEDEDEDEANDGVAGRDGGDGPPW